MQVRCFQGDSETIQNEIIRFIKEEHPKIIDIKLTGTSRVREKDDIVFMALIIFEPAFAPILFG